MQDCIPSEEKSQEQKMATHLQNWSSKTSEKIIILNNTFQVQAMNTSASTLLTPPATTVVGQTCTKVLRCRTLNQKELCGTSKCPLVQVFQQQRSLTQETLIIGSTLQSSSEMLVSVTPIDTGEEPLAIFSMQNFPSIKVTHFVRSNALSMLSHELRTPLNSAQGFINLLLWGHMGKLETEQQTYLGYAQEGLQQLTASVEDILFMTHADLGQFEVRKQKEQVSRLVLAAIRAMQPQALKAEVALVLDIPADTPSLSIDPQQIQQVLIKLISHALKFTSPGGTITIHSQGHDERFEMISVTDTGFGIPAADQPHLFERFYQSDHIHTLRSKMGGYGLDLPIAKFIVEQHGGILRFNSSGDHENTFSFTVPRFTEVETDLQ